MLALNRNLTAQERLTRAVIGICGNPKYVALAGVLMLGEKRVDSSTPTACTNGRDEFYGEAFVDSLTDAELRFLVLHECYHKLYRHLITWRHLWDKNPQLANKACDYVINIKLTDDNPDNWAVMPANGLLDAEFRGMNAAEVFKMLEDEEENGGGSGCGEPLDDHDWEGADGLTPDEVRDLERDIDEAIRQGALVAGKLGSGDDRDLQQLLQPQVNWREELREFISSTCAGSDYSTWARPNRRFLSAGVYLPSGISERIGELVVSVDMSGSIHDKTVAVFLSEVKNICDTVRPERVRLLYWDTKVCQDEVYDAENINRLITSTKPKGGGGTDVTCIPAYLTEHSIKPQAVVVLTDGYVGSNWGSWNYPVLWCIIDNESARPSTGRYVNIKSNSIN
jgi:predicted metal-dependent peptidase